VNLKIKKRFIFALRKRGLVEDFEEGNTQFLFPEIPVFSICLKRFSVQVESAPKRIFEAAGQILSKFYSGTFHRFFIKTFALIDKMGGIHNRHFHKRC
jgi:hypothetical protein